MKESSELSGLAFGTIRGSELVEGDNLVETS